MSSKCMESSTSSHVGQPCTCSRHSRDQFLNVKENVQCLPRPIPAINNHSIAVIPSRSRTRSSLVSSAFADVCSFLSRRIRPGTQCFRLCVPHFTRSCTSLSRTDKQTPLNPSSWSLAVRKHVCSVEALHFNLGGHYFVKPIYACAVSFHKVFQGGPPPPPLTNTFLRTWINQRGPAPPVLITSLSKVFVRSTRISFGTFPFTWLFSPPLSHT